MAKQGSPAQRKSLVDRVRGAGDWVGGADIAHAMTKQGMGNEGYVVVGLDYRQAQFEDNLAVVWHKWTPTGPDTSEEDKSQALGGQGGQPVQISARTGHVAIGIHGRSAGYVDRLSLITAKPVTN